MQQIRIALRAIPICVAFLLAMLVVSSAPSKIAPPTTVTPAACNSVAFRQIPDRHELMIGRHLLNAGPSDCSGSRFTLALYAIDWVTGHIVHVRDLVSLPVRTVEGGMISTAYDPSVIRFGGSLWAAFECSGTGPSLDGVASSCIARLDPNTYRVDPSTLHVIVAGKRGSGTAEGLSASVPKLFVYRGRPYLYWSMVQLAASPTAQYFGPIVTRGAELVHDREPSGSLWVSGSIGRSLSTNDPVLSVEVLGVVPSNPLLNGVADSFDVRPTGGRLLLTVGVGGQACTTPISVAYGCYRFQIRVADKPLGYRIYNELLVDPRMLPANPTEYSIFVDTAPDSHVRLLGRYFVPNTTGSAKPNHSYGDGMSYYDIGAPSALRFLANDPTPRPSPIDAVQSLTPEFDSLKRFMPGCNAGDPIPGPGETSCLAATARYCASQGYNAGGLLLDYIGSHAGVVCVGIGGQRLSVEVSRLTAIDHRCGVGNPVSEACSGAINDYCVSQGFAGGFGPAERENATMLVTCMSSKIATLVSTTFGELQQHQAGCREDGWTSSSACLSAVASVCRASGYEAGFGIVRRMAAVAVIGCLRKGVEA